MLLKMPPQRPGGAPHRKRAFVERELDVWKRGALEKPMPCAAITGDADVVPLVVHRQREVMDIARKAAGLGMGSEVENSQRLGIFDFQFANSD
jgi:hypothetical protein